jgi:hypothetical protein
MFSISLPLFAIKGKYSENNSESICKLSFEVPCEKDKTRYCKGICTATYIGNKKIISADHCRHSIEWSIKTELLCDNSNPVTVIKSHQFPKNSFDTSQDVALFDLESEPINKKTNKNLKSMKIPVSSKHTNELLSHPESCFIAGYGLDNDEKFGTLRTSKVDKLQKDNVLRTNNGFSYYSAKEQVELQGNYADSGDSGGPVYCKNEQGEFVLVAINQGSTKGLDLSYAEKVSAISEWVNFHLGSHSDQTDIFTMFKKQSRMCNSILYCLEELDQVSTTSKEILNVIRVLAKDLAKENLRYTDIEKNISSDEVLVKLEEINEQWSLIHKQCFDILY